MAEVEEKERYSRWKKAEMEALRESVAEELQVAVEAKEGTNQLSDKSALINKS